MDINLPGMNGVECVRQLKQLIPSTQMVMLTVYEDTENIFNALAAGATEARVSGIKALPTTGGSLLRIGDEWVRYDDFRGGRISGLRRGQLRSTDANQGDRSLILAGQPFSLVVALPR